MLMASLHPSAGEEVLNWLMEDTDGLFALPGPDASDYLRNNDDLSVVMLHPATKPSQCSKRKRRGAGGAAWTVAAPSVGQPAPAKSNAGRKKNSSSSGSSSSSSSSSVKVNELQDRLDALEEQNLQMRLQLKIGPHDALQREEQAPALSFALRSLRAMMAAPFFPHHRPITSSSRTEAIEMPVTPMRPAAPAGRRSC